MSVDPGFWQAKQARAQWTTVKERCLLSELQELSVTVRNLAWNVTSDMVRMTFEQVAVVVTAAVQHDEDTGRSLGWAVVEFGRGSDAAGAVARFSGVELVGRRMVVEFGAGRDCEEDVI